MAASTRRSSSGPANRRLLGGLDATTFLARHWQRKPLLIRAAVDDVRALPSRDTLFALAARDDVEARVVATTAGRWTLAHGPFARLPRARRDWTLLVQGVNLVDVAADALMRRFDFVSTMRLDDVMMSYAVDGGGVGPHLDSYDVFLLQVDGTRRWRWRDNPSTSVRSRALVPDRPLKLLANFAPTDEALLEPGDMLYLPPSCAHEGVAVGSCTTASIGFRTPSWNALTREFLLAMAEETWPDGRPDDAGRRPTSAPAALDPALVAAVVERFRALRFATRDIETFVGRHFSEPKAQVWFERPPPLGATAFARRAARDGLVVDRRATVLHRGERFFVAGESYDAPANSRKALAHFADRRRLDPGATAALLEEAGARALLHEWWQHGWIAIADHADRARGVSNDESC